MTTQGSFFDKGESLHRKEEGMDFARGAKHIAEWKRDFMVYLQGLALRGEPFTSEDITYYIGLPRGNVRMNANNAVGAMVSGAARRGIIEKTGRHRKSQRPTSHGAELIEWVGTNVYQKTGSIT